MYRYLILLISLISMQSCGQKNTNMNQKATEILGNLYKDVKYYDERVNYHADIFIGGCNYEILINDFPVDSYFGPGNGAMNTSIPINTAILNKGEQTWKIKVYPVHDNKSVNGIATKVARPNLQDGARVEIKIEGVRFSKDGNIEKSFGKIVDFKASTVKDEKTGKNVFADKGKPYVEYTGTFKTETPYSLEGWKNSTDLTLQDKEKLTKELYQQYYNIGQLLQQGNLEKIATLKLKGKKEEAQAFFYDKNTNDEYLKDFFEVWGHDKIKVQPIENYSVKFYGNGKVAALVSNAYKESPLWASYKDEEGENSYIMYNLFFHIPQGKKELEIIR